MTDVFKNAVRGGGLFQYVQWHDNAILTTPSMGIPTHRTHDEDYDVDFDETAKELVDFLELPIVG